MSAHGQLLPVARNTPLNRTLQMHPQGGPHGACAWSWRAAGSQTLTSEQTATGLVQSSPRRSRSGAEGDPNVVLLREVTVHRWARRAVPVSSTNSAEGPLEAGLWGGHPRYLQCCG